MYERKANCLDKSLNLKQQQLFNTLRRLWVEHAMWTRFFIVSTAFGLSDLEYVTNRLLRNPSDFAELLRPLYGSEKAAKFQKLFTEHLIIAAKLVDAAKAGDITAADEFRKKWHQNADDIAAFLSEINPFWCKKAWQTMFYDHLKMTENEAAQILTGKYEASISEFDAIQKQALEMGDYMASGVMRQFHV